MTTSGIGTAETSPGFFDISSVPAADNRLLTEYTTTGWAGMDVLLVVSEGRLIEYPHIRDQSISYKREFPRDHPLVITQELLRGSLFAESPLARLSNCVGQIVIPERTHGPVAWELALTAELIGYLEDEELVEPSLSWDSEDWGSLFSLVREKEAVNLSIEVAKLAGKLVAENQLMQMYVQKERAQSRGSGWLGALTGLTIDTKNVNEYHTQVHDVIPVVRQNDDTVAVMYGADATLYTKL